mmetsp:Transcript_53845/g.112445  ORF Transcript_53845/g.112445 Transcript_53845/m.112445 type:complete len:210 (-) Transcript_53845:419-1048(-)
MRYCRNLSGVDASARRQASRVRISVTVSPTILYSPAPTPPPRRQSVRAASDLYLPKSARASSLPNVAKHASASAHPVSIEPISFTSFRARFSSSPHPGARFSISAAVTLPSTSDCSPLPIRAALSAAVRTSLHWSTRVIMSPSCTPVPNAPGPTQHTRKPSGPSPSPPKDASRGTRSRSGRNVSPPAPSAVNQRVSCVTKSGAGAPSGL